MYGQVVENMLKFSDSAIQMQHDLFKKWVSLFPAFTPTTAAATGAPADPMTYPKKGLEIIGELIQKECEALEAHFKVGMRNIEDACQLVKAKDADELRAKTAEIWQRSVEAIRQASETRVRDFKYAASKWTDVVTKGAA